MLKSWLDKSFKCKEVVMDDSESFFNEKDVIRWSCHDFFLGWSQKGTFSSRRLSLGRSTVRGKTSLKCKVREKSKLLLYILCIHMLLSSMVPIFLKKDRRTEK